MEIKCIFFDLDNTLWDFSASANIALADIFERYVRSNGHSQEKWRKVYNKYNEDLWALYRLGRVDSDTVKFQRFARAFHELGLSNLDYTRIAHDYLELLVSSTVLFPGVVQTLDCLHRRFTLGVITNGFAASTQRLSALGLDKHFSCLVTSEAAGVPKPNIYIFQHALEKVGCSADGAAYVGDDYDTDIIGAKAAGLRAVLFNHKGIDLMGRSPQPDYVVTSFEGLKAVFLGKFE